MLALVGLCLVLAASGCASLLGQSDTTYKDKAGSLATQASFYAALLPTIKPPAGRKPAGKAMVLAPTFASALASLPADSQRSLEDREYQAKGMGNECKLLTDVLRARGLFTDVAYRETDNPAETALGLAEDYAAVIYLDPRQPGWFYLPQNGAAAARIDLGMYLARNQDDVRAWLGRVQAAQDRPPLAKAAPPPPPPEPPKPLAKPHKAPAKALQPAPYGLMWGAKLADLRRSKCKLGPHRQAGNLMEYPALATPQHPADTERLTLSLHKVYGLQQIVWREKPVDGDPYGFLGRERFLRMQSALEAKYGPPSSVEKSLDQKQLLSSDQFYECLGHPGCASWKVFWRLPGMTASLELVPAGEAKGALVLTFQGPEWRKVAEERQPRPDAAPPKSI